MESIGFDRNIEEISNKYSNLTIGNVMRERAWLLHWSLFIFFNEESWIFDISELFFDEKFMNCIQTVCPHLLRYLASSIIITQTRDIKQKMNDLNMLCRYIIEEEYTYTDCILIFIKLLVRENNFIAASKYLNKCIYVIKNDFFLSYYQNQFFQFARLLFFTKYCKLYSRVSVDNLAKLLLLNDESMEEIQNWIVKAIRNQEHNITLDVENNILHIKFKQSNPYQIMKEKTRFMNDRILQLYRELERKGKP